MTASKFLRRTAAAAAAVVLLGTLQSPSSPENRLDFWGLNGTGIWAVEAGNSNGREGEEGPKDLGGGEGKNSEGGGDAKGSPEDSTVGQINGDDEQVGKGGGSNQNKAAKGNGSKKQSNLRGSTSSSDIPTIKPDNAILESIFSSLSEVGKNAPAHPLAKEAQEVKAFNELLDRIFVPRLQTPPKYQGALECLNEAIYRDVLSGPKRVKNNPHLLQQAYSVVRHPPRGLDVPELFIELRQETDKRLWEVRRKKEIRIYERKGAPIPERLELSADEVAALDAEEPRDREEDLSDTELAARTVLIDGWMKEQFRLRLYYSKRIGTLKEDPQDLVDTFNPGPKFISVTVEEIVGLSYNAQLDPEIDIPPATEERRTSRPAEF
ncbi:hypothetical protein, conserved [Eimeria brunetti]|uniref:Uncharacterized protein n=1 Tax=Eimeria brunetti TaxID=51314 RepID=U6LSA1_9EIME|nr:hypothetical protein, conserved [Eimeria brunetti]